MSSSSAPGPANRLHILLVNDNTHGLAARKCVLEEYGYQVTTCTTSRDALATFLAGPVDLVVTDYKMPDMNGVELIRKLRAHVPGLRVVVMSGIADTLGLSEANTGADAVIQKSANEVPQLVRCVNRLLGRDAPRKPPRSYRQARQPGRKSIY